MIDLDMKFLTNIDEVPGVDGTEIVVYEPLVLEDVESNAVDRTSDLQTDYAKTRQQMHYAQQMLLNAATIALENAKNGDGPKQMEVFASLMGQYSGSSKDLLKLHKEMKEITSEQTSAKGSGTTTNQQLNIANAQVFVGGPTDLMDNIGDAFSITHGSVEEEIV